MSSALSISSVPATRSGPRTAFLEYAEATLSALLGACALLAGGRPARASAFQLRGRGTFDPIPLAPRDGGELMAANLRALLRLTLPDPSPASLSFECLIGDRRERGVVAVSPAPDDDFVFSYPLPLRGGEGHGLIQLRGLSSREPAAPQTRGELIAQALSILLDVVDLLDGEAVLLPDAVEVDGERCAIPIMDPFATPDLGARAESSEGASRRQPLHSVLATEPAIVALARHWALMLEVVRFPDPIEAIRLRSAADWVLPSGCHPSEVYEYLARVCNVSCKFCYLYGNPSTMAIARGKKVISQGEIATRMKYFDPVEGRALFKAQWEINEFLVDPKLDDVLRRLRSATPEPFYFITNGSPLVPRVIDLLAEVQPVELIVSINSIDQDVRAQVMNEKNKQTLTAVQCFEQLAAKGIVFGLSLAAFPEFPLDLLERTIRTIEPLQPAFVRINLPGFTREMPYESDVDLDDYWWKVVRWIRALRSEVSTPLITIPSAFEENFFEADPLGPRILGVVPNSPAAASGLAPGDRIDRINGFPIRSRAELISLLRVLRRPAALSVERAGQQLVLSLDPSAPSSYPFPNRPTHRIAKYVFPWGVVSAASLSSEHARQIRRKIEEAGAERVWLITSPLMEPAARALLERELPDLVDRIELPIVQNEYLGGNIRVMDMSTIGDLARALERLLVHAPKPDLVLLPDGGFNFQGRDIAGRHWSDLERWFGRPVRLLEVSQFLY